MSNLDNINLADVEALADEQLAEAFAAAGQAYTDAKLAVSVLGAEQRHRAAQPFDLEDVFHAQARVHTAVRDLARPESATRPSASRPSATSPFAPARAAGPATPRRTRRTSRWPSPSPTSTRSASPAPMQAHGRRRGVSVARGDGPFG